MNWLVSGEIITRTITTCPPTLMKDFGVNSLTTPSTNLAAQMHCAIKAVTRGAAITE